MFITMHSIKTSAKNEKFITQANSLMKDELYTYYNIKYLNKNHVQVSAVFNELNNVVNKTQIAVAIDGQVKIQKCDCKNFGINKVCSHTVGAMLLLLKLPQTTALPFTHGSLVGSDDYRLHLLKNQAKFGSTLVKNLEADFHNEINYLPYKGKVKLIPKFKSIDGNIEISFKLGYTRTYIIKDLLEFKNAIENKIVIEYGKDLALLHNVIMFDTNSQLWLEFIQTYALGTEPVKSITLNRNNLESFFNIINTTNPELTAIYNADLKLDIAKETIKEHVFYTIKKTSEDIDIINNAYYDISFDQELNIIKYELDDECHFINLYNNLTKQKEILFEYSDFLSFYSYSISPIEDYLSLMGEEITFIKCEDIKLYGDANQEGYFTFDIEYKLDGKLKKGFTVEHPPTNVFRLESALLNLGGIFTSDGKIALSETNADAIDFIQSKIYDYQNFCSIYISEQLKHFGEAKKLHFNIGVGVVNNLLEINLSSLELEKDEIIKILKDFRSKKKYTKLKNGETISILSNEIEKLDRTLFELGVNDLESELHIPAFRALTLDNVQDEADIIWNRSKEYSSYLERFNNVKDFETPSVPENYTNILREYQVYGFRWLKRMNNFGFGAILADEMGLGKSIQMITYIESTLTGKPHLIVAPASLILNWQEEIIKFTNNLKVLLVYGSREERENSIKEIPNYDIVVTSYDYLKKDINDYLNITFETIILDEAQYIKNQRTKASIVTKQINANQKFALTGTPIENNLAELWSLFDFLMPNYLYNYHYFKNKFEIEIIRNNNQEVLQKLKELVQPFILRRTKKEVLKEIPDKKEHLITIPFTVKEKALYYSYFSLINQELQNQLNIKSQDKIKILAMITNLRQLCCDSRIIDKNVEEVSSKLLKCLDLINELNSNNKNVLVFSTFTSVLDLIEIELQKQNISYLKLTGKNTKVQRKEMVDTFQKGDIKVFLISLKAGGTGLNLTNAQSVIHFDPWWNSSAENQATDRAHRFGQTNVVDVYKLIMQDSIEEKIQDLQEKKKKIINNFIEDNNYNIEKISFDDIKNLFTQ